MGTNFGEAYDKEWAIQDQARRDGIEEGKIENAKELAVKFYKKGVD